MRFSVKAKKCFLYNLLDTQFYAPSDLQPHYGNGVFGHVYLLSLDDTKGQTDSK